MLTPLKRDSAFIALCVIALSPLVVLAGGGAVQILGTYVVNLNTCCFWRFEPSSAATSTWLHSWMELPNSTSSVGWTAALNGGSWVNLSHGNVQDLYLAPTPTGYADLTMLDLNYNLYFQGASSTSGTSWYSAVDLLAGADFPSIAIAQNGNIAIGYDDVYGGAHYTVTWNSAQGWTGPYYVTNLLRGRITAVGSTFYLFSIDTSNSQSYNLDMFSSTDGGQTWSGPTVLDTFTPPRLLSPKEYSGHGYTGYIDYPMYVDAQGSSGSLGWVVAYSVWGLGENWIKFCAQGLSGCQTISYTADLIYPAITTSTNGDMWLSMFTYTSAPSLQQLAIYRSSAGSFINAPIATSIDPTSWAFFSSSDRCQFSPCFSAGEYIRPAMNIYTGATVPFINYSPTRSTDLIQNFIQDPASGLAPAQGLKIGPVVPFGSDSQSSLSAGETAPHAWRPYLSGVSPLPAR